MITPAGRERDKYAEMWQVPAYGEFSPGLNHLDLFLDMAQPSMRGSLLDAGCGTGRAGVELQARGFDVTLCDFTPNGLTPHAKALPFVEACLWSNLKRVTGFKDWVYCCDVMEHVPTEYTMLAVLRLLEVARKGVFFSVCHEHDTWGTWVGQTLHETVKPFPWWRDRLAEMGELVEARCLTVKHATHIGLFLVRP